MSVPLFVSSVRDGSAGCCVSGLPTGFCKCSKGFRCVEVPRHPLLKASPVQRDGMPFVFVMSFLTQCHLGSLNPVFLFFFFPPQLKLEDRSVVPRDVVRHMSSSVSAFFLVPF